MALIRFIANGLLVSVIDVGLTYIIDRLTGHRLFAITTGFIAGLTSGYLLHARVTFTVHLDPKKQLPRLLITVMINYLLTLIIVWTASTTMSVSTTTGKIISLPVIALSSYLLSRYWVYVKTR